MTKQNKKKILDIVVDIEKRLFDLEKRTVLKSQQQLGRIPLLLPIIGSFGLVSTFYGFEKILENTMLADQPLIMISLGIILLLYTGAAATKL